MRHERLYVVLLLCFGSVAFFVSLIIGIIKDPLLFNLIIVAGVISYSLSAIIGVRQILFPRSFSEIATKSKHLIKVQLNAVNLIVQPSDPTRRIYILLWNETMKCWKFFEGSSSTFSRQEKTHKWPQLHGVGGSVLVAGKEIAFDLDARSIQAYLTAHHLRLNVEEFKLLESVDGSLLAIAIGNDSSNDTIAGVLVVDSRQKLAITRFDQPDLIQQIAAVGRQIEDIIEL